MGPGNIAPPPTGVRTSDLPVRNESLYRNAVRLINNTPDFVLLCLWPKQQHSNFEKEL